MGANNHASICACRSGCPSWYHGLFEVPVKLATVTASAATLESLLSEADDIRQMLNIETLATVEGDPAPALVTDNAWQSVWIKAFLWQSVVQRH